jgi:hypothetical protein
LPRFRKQRARERRDFQMPRLKKAIGVAAMAAISGETFDETRWE